MSSSPSVIENKIEPITDDCEFPNWQTNIFISRDRDGEFLHDVDQGYETDVHQDLGADTGPLSGAEG
jgi:hypothetical protein